MSSEDILFKESSAKSGIIAEVILNRPNALNALTFDMCKRFYDQLSEWQEKEDISAVIVKGVGERAFCAGGDIRKLYDNRDANVPITRDFFWHEYRLNALIHHFKKPYFSFLHHITMGGGAGISINGMFRFALNSLIFAMPETKIGFYPDIGATYFLNHCPGKTGLYLALTGNNIDALTAHQLGLVTHSIPDNNFDRVEKIIFDAKAISAELFNEFSLESIKTEIDSDAINDCFSENSVGAIIQKLESYNEWTNTIAQQLKQRSPTALKVTLELYRRSQSMSFDEIMQMNFDLTQQFLENLDFFEGIRAAIVDKDQRPQWQAAISDEEIETYFAFKGKRLF